MEKLNTAQISELLTQGLLAFQESLDMRGPEITFHEYLEFLSTSDDSQARERLVAVIALLSQAGTIEIMTPSECRRWIQDAEGIIDSCAGMVSAAGEQMLRALLRLLKAERQLTDGETQAAVWELSGCLKSLEEKFWRRRCLLALFRAHFILGQAHEAAVCLSQTASVGEPSQVSMLESYDAHLQRLSLQGDSRYWDLVAASPHPEVAWHALVRAAVSGRQLDDLLAETGKKGRHRTAKNLILTRLWSLAVASDKWQERTLTAAQITSACPVDAKFDPDVRSSLRALKLLDQAAAQSDGLQTRITLLQKLCTERLSTVTCPEQQLLALAASARLLIRWKQVPLASAPLAHYRRLSQTMTGGTSDDCLDVLGDLQSASLLFQDQGPVAAGVVPSGFNRYMKISLLALSSGLSAVRSNVQPWGRIKKKNTADALAADTEFASRLARLTRELRGPFAKFLQMAVYSHPGATPHIRDQLVTSFDRNIPAPVSTIRAAIRQHLGPKAEEVLATMDPEPLGVGAVAQVHRYQRADGRPAVIKVVIPGIESAIRNDMNMARLAAPLLGQWFRQADFDALIRRCRDDFLQETDLHTERQTQERFRARFAGDARIHIPETFPEHCSRGTLAMAFESGLPVLTWANMAPAAQVQAVATTVYDFCFQSFFTHGDIHADPHPGNFLITDDRKVCVIDFGYSLTINPARLENWRRLTLSGMRGDWQKVDASLTALGFVADPQQFRFDHLHKIIDKILEPVATDHGRFTPSFAADILKLVGVENAARSHLQLPHQDAMLARFFWTLQVLLGELHADTNWRVRLLAALGASEEPAIRAVS